MARLSSFIRSNVDPILAEWETFARSVPQGENMNIAALRDHAKAMLAVIADDLDHPQTAKQQTDKSHGESDAGEGTTPTAAQEHGAGRAVSGYSVGQMVAEFRALRASVMRLWSDSQEQTGRDDLTDMTRFNEAIDQAIAESIIQYTQQVEQTKERFLAILGHDLRTPVGAIVTSTRFMLDNAEEAGDLGEPYRTLVEGASRSARRMNQLVADLLEYARVSFGDEIPVQRLPMDMAQLVRDVVAEVRASSPRREFETVITGDLNGEWDADRLFQALTNLLSNAVQHGVPEAAICVTATSEQNDVVVAVHNKGTTISPEKLAQMFQGMSPQPLDHERDRRNLGLGLYIVDKIVSAHGGRMVVRSQDGEGTTFVLRVPRAPAES